MKGHGEWKMITGIPRFGLITIRVIEIDPEAERPVRTAFTVEINLGQGWVAAPSAEAMWYIAEYGSFASVREHDGNC